VERELPPFVAGERAVELPGNGELGVPAGDRRCALAGPFLESE
jgi:hypothetical protein